MVVMIFITHTFSVVVFILQRDYKEQLKHGLASLPRPKNDYEIVVPDDMEQDIHEPMQHDSYVEDQADIDAKSEDEKRAISKL
jgi:pre-mRNA-splicing factor CDC5/CEF1